MLPECHYKQTLTLAFPLPQSTKKLQTLFRSIKKPVMALDFFFVTTSVLYPLPQAKLFHKILSLYLNVFTCTYIWMHNIPIPFVPPLETEQVLQQ